MTETIERVRVLHGHVSPDTGYLVDDYPYGRRLRCQIRYWVETAVKGAAKGQQRFVSQTTNPKVPGEPWNKPHPSTYNDMVVMFLNEEGHVHRWGVDRGHIIPEVDALFRLRGIYEQLTEEQRAAYDGWVARSQRYTEPWTAWAETIFELSEHFRDHDSEPELVEGVWTTPAGIRRYLGRHTAAFYATARNSLTTSSPEVQPVASFEDIEALLVSGAWTTQDDPARQLLTSS